MNRALLLAELVIGAVWVMAIVLVFHSEEAVSPADHDHPVTVAGGGFSPTSVTVPLGAEVTWRVAEDKTYTVSSPAGFFDSGPLGGAATYATRFADAGTFGYRSMRDALSYGVVHVPVRAHGSASKGWRISWTLRAQTPTTRRYDVQLRRPGSSAWRTYRENTATGSAEFRPRAVGTYEFRARTDNLSRSTTSGWSPELKVKIS